MYNVWAEEMKIDDRTVKAATDAGLDPEVLDYHVEGIHGWETHDEGFVERGLAGAVRCLRMGGCAVKKDAATWAKELGIVILDPDGWRKGSVYGALSMDVPIIKEDFERRVAESTVGPRRP